MPVPGTTPAVETGRRWHLGRLRAPLAATALVLLSGAATSTLAAQTGAPDGEWPVYGGDLGHTRYAPLDQIDSSNVADLGIAWRWSARNFGPRPETENQTVPLMIDGVLYATAGSRRAVVAIDAGTGETLWMWSADEGRRWEEAPRRTSGRGVAYWQSGEDRRIFTVTPGFHLVALDATTGWPVDGFGTHGTVDMFEGLRWRGDGPESGAIGNSSPPLVVGDAVVVGPALKVGYRVRSRANVPGDVRAFDVRTGRLLWTFHTIPTEGEFGYDTWLEGSAEYTGNAGAWAPMSADPELGLVYVPVEAATSDAYGGHRPGDNLFSSTLVALDARTGERVWHYQLVHHDIWDWDIPAHPILADVVVDGRPRKIVVQLTKQAFAFAFDRETGEPVWPIEERPVPQSDVPGEWTSPTQPFPTRPAPFDLQGLRHDDLNDLTPPVRSMAEEAVEDYRLLDLYEPLSAIDAPDGTRGSIQVPGPSGGARWEAGALDVETDILYVASATEPFRIALLQDPEFSDLRYVASFGPFTLEDGIPLTRPPWGRITAIDLNTGEHVWMVPNGRAPARFSDHPALAGADLSRTGKPLRSLTLATKTLLFTGEGLEGDHVFRALDKATGETVAELDLPAEQIGLAMTYMHEGRQYIAFTVGGGGHPAEVVALALPAG